MAANYHTLSVEIEILTLYIFIFMYFFTYPTCINKRELACSNGRIALAVYPRHQFL